MLNSNNERELAYFARVTNISAMDAKKLECVCINGWTCVCGKGNFNVGDVGIFFEPDSKLPNVEPFSSIKFLKEKDFKVKPQKIRGVVSQGLFIPLSDLLSVDASIVDYSWLKSEEEKFRNGENIFLTQRLSVTYNDPVDAQRKSSEPDKYKQMTIGHKRLLKAMPFRFLMRYNFGRKLLFFFLGKKKSRDCQWPEWVTKTDEERCQNMPWLFDGTCNEKWIATEKIDGTSTTFTLRGNPKKSYFYVCSRNVAFCKSAEKECFENDNVYIEMAKLKEMVLR